MLENQAHCIVNRLNIPFTRLQLEHFFILSDLIPMRFLKSIFLASIVFSTGLSGQETILPEFLQVADVPKEPYKYNGLLYVGNAVGSASMVGQGVFATAAHVIYDDEDLTWEPIARIFYYPKYHRTTPFNPQGTSYQPIAVNRWTSYATRVETDESPVGQSTPDTFNLDFAVGYVNKFVSKAEVLEHAEVHVDLEEEVGILRDDKLKMIVGYPSDLEFIPSHQRGLMHKTQPDNYFCYWGGLSDLEQTWRDSENLWIAMHNFEGVTSYGGNSGGPMYVEEIDGEWSFAGIVVGSDSADGVLVRAIDENAWQLIQDTIAARDIPVPVRVNDLMATSVSSGSVSLSWTDSSSQEDSYRILRNEDGSWIELTQLPGDEESYDDNSVNPGHVYQYRVQPISDNGNRPPKSESVVVNTPGSNSEAGNHLGQWALKFSNSGQSNWFVDDSNRLRAGKARSLGSSSLGLEIIGPGSLSFTWSVSSELNLEYTNPLSPYEGDIYDAIYLLLDGEPVMNGEEPVFLSGLQSAQAYQLNLPEGEHLVEWVYEKDPYTSEEADTGFLDSLTWTPGANPYPVYGGFGFTGSDWHGSTWFGNYFAQHFPWVGHSQMGWFFMHPGDGYNLYLYSVIPELGNMYTTPFNFPYFYRLGSSDWIYVYPGSGNFGSDLWYYDLTAQQAIYIP